MQGLRESKSVEGKGAALDALKQMLVFYGKEKMVGMARGCLEKSQFLSLMNDLKIQKKSGNTQMEGGKKAAGGSLRDHIRAKMMEARKDNAHAQKENFDSDKTTVVIA